jgi:hypothetical protein
VRPGIDHHGRAGEFARRQRRERFHATRTRFEGVGEFARHGDDVTIGRSHARGRLRQRLHQGVDAEPQRRGYLHRVDDAAVVRAGGFEMDPPDIPSDGGAHV